MKRGGSAGTGVVGETQGRFSRFSFIEAAQKIRATIISEETIDFGECQ